MEAVACDVVAVALEAVFHIGDLDINLTLVEDVVRKGVVFAVGSTGLQLDARHTLEEEAAVDQELVAVNELDAFARIVVVECAMADGHMIAGRSVQSGERSHNFNIGNPHCVFLGDVFQLDACPVVRNLITEQID